MKTPNGFFISPDATVIDPVPPPSLKVFNVGDMIARQYRVEKVLGAGSGGIVYLCVNTNEEDQRVAVKIPFLPPVDNEEDLIRFHTEGRAARRVKSPFVVKTYDLLMDDGIFALIMEYVPGMALSKLMEDNRAKALQFTWKILTQIALGLEAIHKLNIVHYDLKPSNVLLDETVSCKITDFGVAQLLTKERQRNSSSSFVGTVDYVSPEVVAGQPADKRSDLYAWGVIAYQLFSGHLPFEQKAPCSRLLAKSTQDAPDLQRLCPSLPKPLAQLVNHALMREPEKRVSTASDVVDRLSDSLVGSETLIIEDGLSTFNALNDRTRVFSKTGLMEQILEMAGSFGSYMKGRIKPGSGTLRDKKKD